MNNTIHTIGALKFGDREQIRVIRADENKEYWSHWLIIVTDNFGYQTQILTENLDYACRTEEDAVELAKDRASKWSNLFEEFKYGASRIMVHRFLTEDDFVNYGDYVEYCEDVGIAIEDDNEAI